MSAVSDDASDERLLASTRGEPAGFGAFYRRHEGQVLGYFLARAGDPEVAADLTAETFAAALASAHRFRPRKPSAAAWLFGIARSKLAMSCRRGRVEDPARRRLGMAPLVLTDEAVERIAAHDRTVWALVDELPGDQQDGVRARVIDERDYAEIAKDLRCSEAVVHQAHKPRAGDAASPPGGEAVTCIPGLEQELVAAAARLRTRRRLARPAALAAAAAVAVVVLMVVVVTAQDDADRRPQPVVTEPAPSTKVDVVDVVNVGWDVERRIRFGLDGRVLTVQLLPPVRNQTLDTVSGARISATCGANVAAPPGDPRRETTLTRRWPRSWTSTSYRFPRDVSRWCRLEDQSGSTVAFVRFPGASPGARELITETAIKWARLIASSPQTCNDYMGQTACEQIKCQRVGGTPIPDCRLIDSQWAATFRDATVQTIAIGGDRAEATLSNNRGSTSATWTLTVQLKRSATGEWLIDKLGPEFVAARRAAPQRHKR
jgi:RNA polymerase sigma factor (sigma-70 family)